MTDWTRNVAIGTQGEVRAKFAGPQPITTLEVKFAAQTIGEIDGAELRNVTGIAFAVPRVAGAYNLTVVARDSRGCVESTTAPRTVNVF